MEAASGGVKNVRLIKRFQINVGGIEALEKEIYRGGCALREKERNEKNSKVPFWSF